MHLYLQVLTLQRVSLNLLHMGHAEGPPLIRPSAFACPLPAGRLPENSCNEEQPLVSWFVLKHHLHWVELWTFPVKHIENREGFNFDHRVSPVAAACLPAECLIISGPRGAIKIQTGFDKPVNLEPSLAGWLSPLLRSRRNTGPTP